MSVAVPSSPIRIVSQRVFAREKAVILSKSDKSSKASWDKPILDILDNLNARPDYLTLSSCSGRAYLWLTTPSSSSRRQIRTPGNVEATDGSTRSFAAGRGGADISGGNSGSGRHDDLGPCRSCRDDTMQDRDHRVVPAGLAEVLPKKAAGSFLRFHVCHDLKDWRPQEALRDVVDRAVSVSHSGRGNAITADSQWSSSKKRSMRFFDDHSEAAGASTTKSGDEQAEDCLSPPDFVVDRVRETLLLGEDLQVPDDPVSEEQFPPAEQPAPLICWLRYEPFILHLACRDLDAAGVFLARARKAFPNSSLLTWTGKRIVVQVCGEENLDMPWKRVGFSSRNPRTLIVPQERGEFEDYVNSEVIPEKFRRNEERTDLLRQELATWSSHGKTEVF